MTVYSDLLKTLSSFEDKLKSLTQTDSYDRASSREAAAALLAAVRSTEVVLMNRLDEETLARVLRELEGWVADVAKKNRYRRLRDPEIHFLLESRCEKVRLPGPDSQEPFCLILVGFSDRDLMYVEWLLGDGYIVQECRVEAGKAHGASVRCLGSALDGLDGQTVHIVEVQ